MVRVFAICVLRIGWRRTTGLLRMLLGMLGQVLLMLLGHWRRLGRSALPVIRGIEDRTEIHCCNVNLCR